MDKLDAVFYSINQNLSSAQVRYNFYAMLQAIIKRRNPHITGSILWPPELFEFLKNKGHEPSSKPPTQGTPVSMLLILDSLIYCLHVFIFSIYDAIPVVFTLRTN